MTTSRPTATPVDPGGGWSRCWHCGRGTQGGTHRGQSDDPEVRGYATWARCRSKDLKEYQLTLPDPEMLTDPTAEHPQMTRLAFERGPDWLDDEAPRRWGAAMVWWQPTKEFVVQVYVDGRIARSESFEERTEANAWFSDEVAQLRREDSRFRPSPAELAAMPWSTDDDEDPQVPA